MVPADVQHAAPGHRDAAAGGDDATARDRSAAAGR
jgi:hypothetical protein